MRPDSGAREPAAPDGPATAPPGIGPGAYLATLGLALLDLVTAVGEQRP